MQQTGLAAFNPSILRRGINVHRRRNNRPRFYLLGALKEMSLHTRPRKAGRVRSSIEASQPLHSQRAGGRHANYITHIRSNLKKQIGTGGLLPRSGALPSCVACCLWSNA